MTTAAVKITSKGQVTIPKKIREKLKTNTVYFEMKNDTVIVKPVRDAAGSLREYAKNVKPDMSIKQMREIAWEEAMREKADKKSS
ncbi:AbrB family transcriptional regulator [hot springs metagenome]|uniref:AbrB family transcriptional regulator n=1 Tax=hot springs metagenome TaxID=433727 RepID=A0A5J4L7K0_9ZZZZ